MARSLVMSLTVIGQLYINFFLAVALEYLSDVRPIIPWDLRASFPDLIFSCCILQSVQMWSVQIRLMLIECMEVPSYLNKNMLFS